MHCKINPPLPNADFIPLIVLSVLCVCRDREMFKISVLFACFTSLLMLLSPPHVSSKSYCEPSSCGNVHNIRYPFRLKSDPPHCGLKKHELSCDENNRTILQWRSGRFYVVTINYYSNYKIKIQVVDPGIQKDNCSAWPLYSLTDSNSSSNEDPYYFSSEYNSGFTYVKCATKVNSSGYIDTGVCSNTSENTSFTSPLLQTHHTYVLSGSMTPSDVVESCTIGPTVWASNLGPEANYTSFRGIHDGLAYGFELGYYRDPNPWLYAYCLLDKRLRLHCHSSYKCFSSTPPYFIRSSFRCIWYVLSSKFYFDVGDGAINMGNQVVFGYEYIFIVVRVYIALAFAARAVCGISFFFVFLVYKWRRRHFSMYENIEDFIQSHNNLMPVRYSYSDIKKMTKRFKDKLGEGGYGCVYKGKLRSGLLVAVKILGNSKANGQDFINEVATIGRIHHVNVVQLIGFCVERSKRALVYDFMPNGSLEKYIFPREEGNFFLSCEKLYEISLGIAHGIEYLHRGCDMQILHFDIKPHNILLDNKFIPKVSDFGLAKLYPTNDSIVNLTAARGTMGYMAPELFYKNIGGVSYKADVYSFGMLLMEMDSKRKNLNPFVEHLSQIYFPSWVYDQFNDGNDIEMGDATEEERKIVMKMIIVALWCIQMKPIDRPSMSKVVEMLEGDVELLGMPPKPLLYPQEMSIVDQANNNIPAGAPASSLNAMDTITIDGR